MNGKYRRKFPIDEYGRVGGLFSLADIPVRTFKVLERDCKVLKRDTEKKLYEIEDIEKGWTFVLPFDKVDLEDEDE